VTIPKLVPERTSDGNATLPSAYQKPQLVVLGKATELTRNSNGGPFVDGASDNTYRWKAG